jgi:hypothetical protein
MATEVRSCCPCGAASSSRQAPDAAGDLAIVARTYRDPATATKNIAGRTFPVMVGEKVTLTAECATSGTSLASVAWVIPGTADSPPTAVASYEDAKGDPTGKDPVYLTDLGKNPITFYIASAAPRPLLIKANAEVDGKPVTAKTTLHVYTPTLTKPTARTCRVAAKNATPVEPVRPVVPPGVFLGSNDVCHSAPGITWKLKANVPGFTERRYTRTRITGELAMSQLINITATGTLKGASKPQTWGTRGKWCSDNWPLYHQGTGYPLKDTAPTVVNVSTGHANPAWESLDVPGLGGLKDHTTGSVSGKYRDFVLYRPANGIWVPLGGFTWAFSGSVTIGAHDRARLDAKPAPTWPGSPKKTKKLPFLSRAVLAHAAGSWWPTWRGTFNYKKDSSC